MRTVALERVTKRTANLETVVLLMVATAMSMLTVAQSTALVTCVRMEDVDQ